VTILRASITKLADFIDGNYIGTNCPQVEMMISSGKNRNTFSRTTKDVFRLIQFIKESGTIETMVGTSAY